MAMPRLWAADRPWANRRDNERKFAFANEDTMSSHMIRGRQLSRDTEHRKALRRNLVQSLFENGKVRTTLPKAKEVKAFAERLITLARTGSLTARRRVISALRDRRLVDEEQEFT